jgi:hypothetical protein
VTVLFKNNASSRLYAAIDAVTTSIRVQDGDGAKFPAPTGGDYCMVTLEDRRSGQVEITKCTGRSGDILNVTRAQEGTTGQAFALGATVSNRMTAGTITDFFYFSYSRDESDLRYVNETGDAMSGPLTLMYAIGENPVDLREAVHKDYVDRRVAAISQLTVSSATSLVYQAAAGQTVFDFMAPDIYGHTYQLSTTGVEPVEVHVAGLKKVENTGGGLGEYTVNRAANNVTLDTGATVGQFIAIDIYTPRDVSPVVTTWLLKAIVPDGTTTVFEMRAAKNNALIDSRSSEEVAIYVNNVPQKPDEDYTALGSVLTFSEAPEADADIWGVWTKTGGEPTV